MTNVFVVLQMNTLAHGEKCVLLYSTYMYKHWFKLPPHTATHVATCTSDFQAKLFSKLLLTGTHLWKLAVARPSYSPAKYATLTSDICNSVLCWNQRPSTLTKSIDKTINELLLTLLAACTTRVQYPGVAWVYLPHLHSYCVKGQQEAYAWKWGVT